MSSEHHLTMGEYQELAALLKKAEQDGRLGEAMVFSGVANSVQPALDRYQNSLNGGYIPIPLNLEAMLHAKPEAPTIPTPKSVSQKGRDALASMAASSSTPGGPGTTTIQMPDGTVVTRELSEGSWYVNGRGEMVQKGYEQETLRTPMHATEPGDSRAGQTSLEE